MGTFQNFIKYTTFIIVFLLSLAKKALRKLAEASTVLFLSSDWITYIKIVSSCLVWRIITPGGFRCHFLSYQGCSSNTVVRPVKMLPSKGSVCVCVGKTRY